VWERSFDEATGKGKTRLRFEEHDKPPGFKEKHNPLSRPAQEAGIFVHNKVHSVEKDNSGVEGAHKSEELAERGARYGTRKVREGYRSHKSDFATEKIVILSTHIVSDVSYIADTILMMKDGTFLLQEPMSTVTDNINGKVWELLVSDREAAEYSSRFSVVNLHHENGKVRLRMIHDTPPTADAMTVPPSLEDLFMYHFGEEAERSE